MFHKEGGKIILVSTTLTVALLLLTDTFVSTLWLQKTIEIVVLLLLIIVLQFYYWLPHIYPIILGY